MAEYQLKKIRPLGKLEEISAVAHHIDFFTNTGLSVHYRLSQPSAAHNLQPLIYIAVAEVIRLHHILFAVPIVTDTEEPYWGRLPSINVEHAVSFVERSRVVTMDDKGRDAELDALLEDQHNTSFKPGCGTLPVWRLVILQAHAIHHQFTACFIAHHSLSDGTASQIFQNSFQKALCNITSSSSLYSKTEHIIYSNDNDPIAPSLEELHPLPIPVDFLVANTPVLYEWTGSPVQLPCKTRYASLSLASHLTKPFAQECKEHKVTPTAALPSVIAKLLYSNLPPTTEALTCNFPVSLRTDLPPKIVDGVMGNFIDDFKVKLLRSDLYVRDPNGSSTTDSYSSPDSTEIWNHASKIQTETRRYFSNVSPSGEPYTNIAVFKLIPDLRAALIATLGRARGESFELSNLGTFSKPTNLNAGPGPIWEAGRAIVSRCAYAAGGLLVVCVISSNKPTGFRFTW